MSLRAAIELILQEYSAATKLPFARNSVAAFVSNEVPRIVSTLVDNERYLVEGSAGKGRWARVPWVAVFDALITDSAQDGFYIVYLVKQDLSGVYISLNQGVTYARERYRSDAKHALSARAADFAARLGKVPLGFSSGPIDLAVEDASSLGAFYEKGSIISRLYRSESLPSEDELRSDLSVTLALYRSLADSDLPKSKPLEKEDDETHFEDLTRIRAHKRIERNQRLARKVKQCKGLTCESCGFSYDKHYRGIDTDYIEAHHLTPIADLVGAKIPLDPVRDFAVLCANCHRMIHRTDCVHDVAAFREKHLRKI